MFRLVVVFMMLVFFIACTQKSEDRRAATDRTDKTESPNAALLKWGELGCQKRNRCTDIILNLDWYELLQFLETDFKAQVQNSTSQDQAIYQCGIIIGKAWTRIFGGDGMDPQLNNFFLSMIDPVKCLAKLNLEQRLNSYFIQSREYKNEIQ